MMNGSKQRIALVKSEVFNLPGILMAGNERTSIKSLKKFILREVNE
jgi:hypothetical protein